MGHPRLLGRIGQALPLLDLTLGAHRPKILDAVDTVGAADGTFEGGRILQISLDHFDPLTGKILSCGVAWVASQCPQLPTLGLHMANDRSALSPRGSGDE